MSNENATIDATSTIENYVASWNERDDQRRLALIEETWSEDGRYVDPHIAAKGRADISTMIGEAQQRFPGHRIALAAGPDAHNDRVRFIWHLLGPGGEEQVAIGMDFATLAPDGRMREVTGFRGALQ